MNAIVFDIGPELAKIATPVAIAVASGIGAWASNYKTRKEMKPNGGATMRDAVDRTEEEQRIGFARVDAALRGVLEKLEDVDVRQQTQHRQSQSRIDELERQQHTKLDTIVEHVDQVAGAITGETPTT